jgi:hypothetical protein
MMRKVLKFSNVHSLSSGTTHQAGSISCFKAGQESILGVEEMPRNLQDTFRLITYMGIFITFSFWWFSGSTLDERLGNIWLLAVFLPIFIIAYFILGPRIPTEVT